VGYLRESEGRQRYLLNANTVAQIHRSLIQKRLNAMRIFATAFGSGRPRAVKLSLFFWSTSKPTRLAAHTRMNKKGESGHKKGGKLCSYRPTICGHLMIVLFLCRMKRQRGSSTYTSSGAPLELAIRKNIIHIHYDMLMSPASNR